MPAVVVAVADPSLRVRPGEVFVVDVPPPAPAEPVPQAISLVIVFEDDHLVVVDKPAGLVVHPAPGNPDRTLVNALIAHCGNSLSGIGGVMRPGIVHRLDKDTSGLMVVAKNDAAHRALAEQLSEHTVERIYSAVVWGDVRQRRGRITGNIGRNPRNRKKMAVVERGGKPALTHFARERRFGDVAGIVECRLATGRTHQVRVHLAHIGHPIMGDPVYGRSRTDRAGGLPEPVRGAIAALHGQALHARSIRFIHPHSGEFRRFESPLPQDIQNVIDGLELI